MASEFSAEERAAMRQAMAEKRKATQRLKGPERDAAELQDALDAIAGMTGLDHTLAAGIHELVLAAAPQLKAKTWYGFPAYCLDGKVICFFQPAAKFKTRLATFGFQETAQLDDGSMWPVAYAVIELTASVKAEITALVKRAVGSV